MEGEVPFPNPPSHNALPHQRRGLDGTVPQEPFLPPQ